MIAMKRLFLLLALLMVSNIYGYSIDPRHPSRSLMEAGNGTDDEIMNSTDVDIQDIIEEEEEKQGSSKSGRGMSKGGSKGSKKGSSSKKGGSSNKSNKSSKETKRSSKKGSGPSEPATGSPTSENSFAVRPPAWALSYFFDDGPVANPSADDFAALADITRLFLETYMINKYAQTSIIILDDFITDMTRNDGESRPVIGVYRSAARFNPRSIFYPPRSEINAEIEEAFTDPTSQMLYLKKLQELPKDNVFSQVTRLEWGETTTSDTGMVGARMEATGIAAAAAGILLLSAGVILLTRQKELEEDEGNSPDNLKKIDGSSSEAGETESVSFRESTADEDDLQDEPLDDSEDELDPQRLPETTES